MTPLLSDMSPDDMRVTMAELDGWYRYCTSERHLWVKEGSQQPAITLPDYLNSLDAVAPVEARLTDIQTMLMYNFLKEICEEPGRSGSVIDTRLTTRVWQATALQRTKAILLATGKATL